MQKLRELAGKFCADQRGAIALNVGLALLPVMIALSFVLDRAHV